MTFTDHKGIATHVAFMNRQDVGAQDLRRIALRHNHSDNDNFKDDFCNKSFSSPSLKVTHVFLFVLKHLIAQINVFNLRYSV